MQATPSSRLLNPTHQRQAKKIPTLVALQDEVRAIVEKLVEDVQHRPRKNIEVDIADIDRLLIIVRKTGVEPDDLLQLIDLASCGRLSGRLAYMLLLCLIPRTTVPGLAVVKAVSWLCVGNLQPRLQVSLIKWIMAVFYELDSLDELHAVYEMLIFFLEDGRLCQPVAQLLYHLTRKEDVRLHRVKKLMCLHNKMGSATHLAALLQLYKLFQPNLVLLPKQGRQQMSVFNTDNSWTPWISQLHNASSPRNGNGFLTLPKNNRSHQKRVSRDLLQSSFRRRTGQHSVITVTQDDAVVPMEQIGSFQELLHYVDRVQLPIQMSSALRNRDCHIMLVCQPSSDTKIRLDLWLQHALQEAFIQSPGRYFDDYRRQLLSCLVHFQDYIQSGLPSTSRFLVKFLHIWNGEDFQSFILDLIPYFCVVQFKDLKDFILCPLKKLFLGSSLRAKICILKSLIELERNLMQNGCYEEGCFTAVSFSAESFRRPETVEAAEAIIELANYVGSMLCLGLDTEDNNVVLMHLALNFYQLVTDIPLKFGIPVLPSIPSILAHKALLATEALSVSSLCSLFCRYKTAIDFLRKSPDALHNDYTQSSLVQIKTFNELLLIISNALWRNKAFVPISPTSVTFGIPIRLFKSIQAKHKQEALSFYMHVAFLGYALSFQRITMHAEEMEMGNPRYLFLNKPEAASVYLEYLKRQRLPGISEFVKEFIRGKRAKIHDSV